MRKLIVIVSAIAIMTLPATVFGQTSITKPIQISLPQPVTSIKPATSPQVTPVTKPADPGLIDEGYCHQFDDRSCPSPRCTVLPSCPVCEGDFSCHANSYHKPVGTKYEPPLYLTTTTKIRKIELKPTDGIKKIEITDDKGISKTIESEKLNEVVISPDPEKCRPKPCTVLTLKVENGKTTINSEGITAKTSVPIKIEEGKITVTAKDRTTEVLDPAKVKTKVESYTKAQPNTVTITSMNLEDCNAREIPCYGMTNVYKIEGVRQNKFLGLLPVKSMVSYTLNASTGDAISEKSPWYLKTLPFLFK